MWIIGAILGIIVWLVIGVFAFMFLDWLSHWTLVEWLNEETKELPTLGGFILLLWPVFTLICLSLFALAKYKEIRND